MFRQVTAAAALAASLFAGSAQAQENYLTMPSPWAGFYVGAAIGGGWGDGTLSQTAMPAASIPATSVTLGMSGGIVGAVAGYNWRFDRFVIGLEADASVSGVGGSVVGGVTATMPCISPGTCSVSIGNLFTGRVRIGLPIGSFTPMAKDIMPFITGGVAFGDLHGAGGANVTDGMRTGYVVGGGIDVALHDGWAVRGEYLFVDLGSVSSTFGVAPYSATLTAKATGTSIVRVALTKRLP